MTLANKCHFKFAFLSMFDKFWFVGKQYIENNNKTLLFANSDFRFAILAWLIRKQRMKERQRKKIKERERKNSLIEQKLFLKSLIKSCSRHIEVNRMMETMVDCIPSLSWTRVSGTSWSHNWNRDQQHKGRQLRIKCIIAMTGRFAT